MLEPSNCCCPPAKPGVYLTEIINIEFINAFYTEGVRNFSLNFKILKKSKNYLIGDLIYSFSESSDRSAIISHIEFEWIKRFCPELWYHRNPSSCSINASNSISMYLDEIFFNKNNSL